MTAGMVWQDPPELTEERVSRIDAAVVELKKQPGRWALVSTDRGPGGSTEPWKKRGCEVRLSSIGSGRYDIYARWPEAAVSA